MKRLIAKIQRLHAAMTALEEIRERGWAVEIGGGAGPWYCEIEIGLVRTTAYADTAAEAIARAIVQARQQP